MDSGLENSGLPPSHTVAESVAISVLNDSIVSRIVELSENTLETPSTRGRRPALLILESTHSSLLGQIKEVLAKFSKTSLALPILPDDEAQIKSRYERLLGLGKEFATHCTEYRDALTRMGSVSEEETLDEQASMSNKTSPSFTTN